jgi:hypothetical protein
MTPLISGMTGNRKTSAEKLIPNTVVRRIRTQAHDRAKCSPMGKHQAECIKKGLNPNGNDLLKRTCQTSGTCPFLLG